MSLDAFFDAMDPMLRGLHDAATVEQTLGRCTSGTQNLGFYATLVRRNHFKILADVCAPLHKVVMRDDAALWDQLVVDYRAAHPATHWDPNRFVDAFSDFLRARREQHPQQPIIYEELADFCAVGQQVCFGPPCDGDGFDVRLCVRQYSYDLVAFTTALREDDSAALPEPSAHILLIYRDLRHDGLRFFRPNVAGLAALARRQGLGVVPPMFAALPLKDIDAAELAFIERGVLHPKN